MLYLPAFISSYRSATRLVSFVNRSGYSHTGQPGGVAACHYGNVQQFSQFSGFLFSGCPVRGNVFAVEIQKVQTSQLFQRQLGNVASFPERVACAYDHMILIKRSRSFSKGRKVSFSLWGSRRLFNSRISSGTPISIRISIEDPQSLVCKQECLHLCGIYPGDIRRPGQIPGY